MRAIQDLIELEKLGMVSNISWNIDYANAQVDLCYTVPEVIEYIKIDFIVTNTNTMFSEVVNGKV